MTGRHNWGNAWAGELGKRSVRQTEKRTVAESKYRQWEHRLSFTHVIKILCFFREKKKI